MESGGGAITRGRAGGTVRTGRWWGRVRRWGRVRECVGSDVEESNNNNNCLRSEETEITGIEPRRESS